MKLSAVTTAFTVCAAIALSTASAASADPTDDGFIGALNARGLNYSSPSAAIKNAKTVCGLIGPGMTNLGKAASYLSSQTDYSQDQMLAFGNIAISVYCPQKA